MPGPQLSRRGFLVAAGVTVTGIGVFALDPFGGGDGSASPRVRALPGAAAPPDLATHTFDVVIRGGRVMDPDSGFDSVADVGIDDSTVRAIQPDGRLAGTITVDAAGLVVAPGFIDILSYEPNRVRHLVQDRRRRHDQPRPARPAGACRGLLHRLCVRRAPAADELRRRVQQPVQPGELGLGRGRSRDDGADRRDGRAVRRGPARRLHRGRLRTGVHARCHVSTEIKALAEVAKDHDVPATFHARYSDDVAPGTNAEALEEVLRVARDTGVHVHVEHIISTGGTYTMGSRSTTLEKARRAGLKVTACTYPYDFWATYLASARFNDGWQERFHITYSDLAIVGVRRATHRVDVRDLPGAERALRGVRDPGERRPRDARDRLDHARQRRDPRAWRQEPSHASTGCFARADRALHARPQGPSTDVRAREGDDPPGPARRAGRAGDAPKGRLQLGADADITIFDPRRLVDRSTIEAPGVESEGVEYVLVGGQIVRDPQGNRPDVRPGLAITTG